MNETPINFNTDVNFVRIVSTINNFFNKYLPTTGCNTSKQAAKKFIPKLNSVNSNCPNTAESPNDPIYIPGIIFLLNKINAANEIPAGGHTGVIFPGKFEIIAPKYPERI